MTQKHNIKLNQEEDEFLLKFGEELDYFLFNRLCDEKEMVCNYASILMIAKSIEVCWQNTANKNQFDEIFTGIVNRLLKIRKE